MLPDVQTDSAFSARPDSLAEAVRLHGKVPSIFIPVRG
jgi:hypothetical protein